jgi:hypothetical protein
MNYIFKQIDNISGRFAETTVDFNADTITDVLEQFEMFLRGSGFYFTGKLDFVNDDDCGPEWHNEEFNTPKEETHEWTQTLRDDAEWPFPKSRVTESWQGVAPSVAMQWTANELMKGPMTLQSVSDNCSVCGLSFETMKTQKCWDAKCPKGNDAY